jgi:hypothetical protein
MLSEQRTAPLVTMTNNTRDQDTDTHISEQMRAAVGQTLSRRVSYPVTDSDIRKWAVAAYYPESPPARFVDPVAAAATRYGEIVAPEDFNPFAWLAAEESTEGASEDGNNPSRIELALDVPPPAVTFQVNGGLDVSYGVPIRIGDVISSQSLLAEYTERRGRLGLMLFTSLEDIWTNQNGEVVKRSRNTTIRY